MLLPCCVIFLKNVHSSDDLMILGFQVLTFKTLKSRGMTLPRLQQSQIISETPSSDNFYTPLRNAFPKFKAFFVQINSRKERKSQKRKYKKITKLKSFDLRRKCLCIVRSKFTQVCIELYFFKTNIFFSQKSKR